MKIAILGAGAWGTALAITFAQRHEIVLWGRDAAQAAALDARRENVRYLPGFPLPAAVRVESRLPVAVMGSDRAIVSAAVSGLGATLQALAGEGRSSVPVIWVCKGFEAGSGLLPHQVAAEVLGEDAECGALSGPSFAQEVASGLPTAVTLAGLQPGSAGRLARALHSPRLRVYASDDIVGVGVGGAVKNVIAIAAGICDGLGLGLNARAALITRGLAEVARLGEALGGRRDTFMGLAGMGDLILTCTGDLSRNRRVGLELARGKPLARILEGLGHTAEGVSTAREVAALATRLDIDMPIVQAVKAILYDGGSPQQAVEELLSRDPRNEAEESLAAAPGSPHRPPENPFCRHAS